MLRNLLDFFDNWGSALLALLVGDLSAAAISATLVAPIVAAIDRAVVENASFNRPLLRTLGTHALCSLRQPRRFFNTRIFFIVWTLYATTYSTANATESLAKEFLQTADKAAVGTMTFISTFLVNTPLGVWKDVRFAQFYGTAPSPITGSVAKTLMDPTQPATVASTPSLNRRMPYRGVPAAVCATFLLRDSLTIFGSFTLAPQLSAAIPDSLAANPNTKTTITQLVVPVLTQLVATPVHLLGLDLYNRPHAVGLSDRLARSRRNLPPATAMRCFRIIPAFGFGCITNMGLRSFFHEELRSKPRAT
ncbi:hypothetical protein K469DRAFT_734894 [Zopfia rhizophila CBS 207.26]|uniref:Uncharacterized protein n=1 Tax=Zopfia rhizophila CBS 207.26 TaxID=1314779 RepID=A0A6A6ESB6_9PEZI|nr:hypothetical protein K469DRAFT_734894 [Zopfia rhizophila CBS 207.26]